MARTTRIAELCLAWALALPYVVLSAPPQEPAAPSPELLGAGDSVRITVFQDPDLTTEARISERGSRWFSLIGEGVIAGLTPAGGAAPALTPEGAAARIPDRLTRGKFVVKPQVSLAIQQVRSRQVSVLGEVGK